MVVTMALPDLQPVKYQPYDVGQTFKDFLKRAKAYSKTFLDVTEIEDDVQNFINSNPKVGRFLRIKELAAQQTSFELTPMIAKFDAPFKFMAHERELVKQLSHFAVKPKDAVEGVYYHYEMIVPIPVDMLTVESEERLIKEHMHLIDTPIDKDFKKNIIELKPLGIVTRMCGWEGSWIVYSFTVHDDPSAVWSTPLVDAPYKDTQPFLAVKGGEFVILIDDRYEQSTRTLHDVKQRLVARSRGNRNFELKSEKKILANMEWVIAHAITTGSLYKDLSFEMMESSFAEFIAKLTMQRKNLSGPELLKFMTQIIYEP
jgi:hypothetical protein